MFAIIKTGGKQYRVAKNDKIQVEKLDIEEGKKVIFNNVLFIKNDKNKAIFGDPQIKNATVEAEVVRNFKGKKIIIFKKRRRKNSRRKTGHRQQFSELEILNIKLTTKTTTKTTTAKTATKAEPKATTETN